MTRKGRRLALICGALAVVAVAVGLVLFELNDNIVFFVSPTELAANKYAPGAPLRLGGLVETGSVVRGANRLEFKITDGSSVVAAACGGSCFGQVPDLFREGQGVVAEGALDAHGVFACNRILAKHDEKYMPPEVVEELKKQGRWQEGALK
jgi:cytochrome c-type biogenesis protein CcmE